MTVFSILRKWRRRSWLRNEFPSQWERILAINVKQFTSLQHAQRDSIRNCVQVMVNEKYWEGINGQEINDEVKVTISGTAGLLLLGLERPYYYDRLRSIIVYPSVMQDRSGGIRQNGIVDPDAQFSGQAWQGGPLLFSWRDVLNGSRNDRDGHNVVIHEFAHFIDGIDGDMGGMPPIRDKELADRWSTVMRREYDQLCELVNEGMRTPLDPYAATSPAEFFAVASEQFFERPDKMVQNLPYVYDLMSAFYKIDPVSWISRNR